MKRLSAVILAAGCLFQVACSGNTNDANVEAPPPKVVVETLRRETVPITEEYQGTIGSFAAVEIRARVQGVLESAPFKEGQLVRQGALIFQIQQNEYAAALDAAKAQLAQAKGNYDAKLAALRRADIAVARNRPLAADRAIPQKDLDNAIQNQQAALGEVAVAKAQIGEANAAVDTASINYGYTAIYAPVTGLIGFLNYDVGNVVGGPTSQVLDTVTSIDPIKVTFALDESTYLRLAGNRRDANVSSLRDQELRIVLANDKEYQYRGRVQAYNSTVDPKTGTISVEASFPNPDALLRPGGFARIKLVIERRPNALLVPQTAITKSQGVDTVYVVEKDGTAALRSVSLGAQYQQSFVVNSGLNAGERVIVKGTQKVQPGKKVEIEKGSGA